MIELKEDQIAGNIRAALMETVSDGVTRTRYELIRRFTELHDDEFATDLAGVEIMDRWAELRKAGLVKEWIDPATRQWLFSKVGS